MPDILPGELYSLGAAVLKAARAASDRTPGGRRFSWPGDRQAIIAVTLAAAKGGEGPDGG